MSTYTGFVYGVSVALKRQMTSNDLLIAMIMQKKNENKIQMDGSRRTVSQ